MFRTYIVLCVSCAGLAGCVIYGENDARKCKALGEDGFIYCRAYNHCHTSMHLIGDEWADAYGECQCE